MRPVRWNEGLRFGNPNLRWVSPSYLLEPGDEGYTPPPPEPARKKRRRTLSVPATTTPTTTTPTAMSFKYHPAPKSNGGFTTRVALGPEFDQAAMTAEVAAETGVPADKCPLVFQTYVQKILHRAANGCCWSSEFLGMLRVQPTSGGSAALPGELDSAEAINADVAFSLITPVRDAWRGTLSVESQGEVGLLTPVIESIVNSQNDTINTYTPGTLIRVRGDRLKFTKTNTNVGLFLKPGAGAEVRCTSYGTINPGEVIALVPATLTGPLTARFVALINGTLRTSTYTTPLTQV